MKQVSIAVAALALAAVLASTVAEAKCGSRGGPGYRLANGKCASHGR